jgi:hypothetical protein
MRPHPNQRLVKWNMLVILATQESTNKRIIVQVSPGIKQDPISKTRGWYNAYIK